MFLVAFYAGDGTRTSDHLPDHESGEGHFYGTADSTGVGDGLRLGPWCTDCDACLVEIAIAAGLVPEDLLWTTRMQS